MNQNRLFSCLFLAISLLVLFSLGSGCAVEGCTNVNSENFDPDATEDDGTCVLFRAKFIGQYDVAESCPSGNYTFQINIVESSTGEDAIIINNFGDLGAAVSATVNDGSVTIPNQNITSQGVAISINGSGAINGSLLIINYSYNFSGGGETCSMNSTKK